jgi:Ni,Fe-hydrogenase maturation factor
MKPEEVEVAPGGISDVPKMHLMEVLDEIAISGKCPQTVFVGVVPYEIDKLNEELTPEIAAKVPEVIDVIMKQIAAWS